MIARPEITNGIPDCRHIEKGNGSKGWTLEKCGESPKVDSS